MKTLTSLQLRPIVAGLESARTDAGKALVDAEHAHRLTTRRAILSGDYGAPDATAAAVAEAREAHEQAKVAHEEAAALLAEAVTRERAAEEAAIREEAGGKADRMVALAGEADQAIALAVGKIRAAIQAEADARRLCEKELGQPAYGGAALPDALDAVAAYLRSLRTGAPMDFGAFVGDRAAFGAKRIRNVVGG